MTDSKKLKDIEDWELLAEIAGRNHMAFSEMYCRYGKAVFSFIFKMLRQQESAEDACQEVFIRLWQKASSFERQEAKFSTLLFGIANNVRREFCRSAKVKSEKFKHIEPQQIPTQPQSETKDLFYQLALDELSDHRNWRNGQPLPNLAFHLAVYRRREAGIEAQTRPDTGREGNVVKGSSVLRRYLWLRLWTKEREASVDSISP